MEKDKLNEAAKQDAIYTVIGDLYERGNYEMGFVSGAEWLMGQPLSERLSEEERENYRCIYSTAERMIDEVKFVNPQLFDVFNGQLMMLKSIFGKGMFENIE